MIGGTTDIRNVGLSGENSVYDSNAMMITFSGPEKCYREGCTHPTEPEVGEICVFPFEDPFKDENGERVHHGCRRLQGFEKGEMPSTTSGPSTTTTSSPSTTTTTTTSGLNEVKKLY